MNNSCYVGRDHDPNHATCIACELSQAMSCHPVTKESKPAKFRNQKIKTEEGVFDSKKEYSRWNQLKMMQKAGKISNLARQRPFELAPAVTLHGRKKSAIRYFSDFCYDENGKLVVEDAKSPLTRKEPVYRIKIHLLKLAHGIEIVEI